MEKDFEPQKITITVVCGRQLQGRRKGETCRASVVFGLGKELFQTEEIESTQPFWNQEAHVHIPAGSKATSEPIKFKLKDQGHTIGIITLPISSLGRRKQEQWIPFQPYKKEKTYHGDLCLSCYISEVRPRIDSAHHSSSNEDVSGGGVKRGHFDRRSPPVGGVLGGVKSRLSSSSDSDLRKGHYPSSASTHGGEDDYRSRDSSVENISDSLPVPEVTGISPSEGSIEGQEKVILRGTNLGEDKNDIIKVLLVDVDCTSTVEYFSSGKLVVTTLPRQSPSAGPVVVETRSGGVGVSSLHYTYCRRSSDGPSKPDLHGGGGRKIMKLTDQEILDLQMENKSLKEKVKELKHANTEMKEELVALKDYMERVLSTVMANKPELLELASKK